jgi:hypothetical protein
MNIFQILLLVGAGVTALISWKLPHALLWIGLAGLNAVAGYVYVGRGLPHPVAFIFAVDCLLCLAIHWLAKEKYELLIYNCYQVSVFISLLRLVGLIKNEYLYYLLLELVMWVAMLLISGTAILAMVGGSGRYFHSAWRPYARRIGGYLRSPRSSSHWSKNK